MNAVLTILIGSIFVNNFAMSRFYGICTFLGVSKKLETAFGIGMAAGNRVSPDHSLHSGYRCSGPDR